MDIAFSSTDDIQFTTSANNGAWTTEVRNLSTSSNNIFYWIRTGLTSSTVAINNDNTGVFMENKNTNLTWDNQFITKTLTVNQATAKNANNAWVNWEADSKFVLKCGTVKTNDVITGSLGSGSSATWSVTKMADNWPACTP